MFALLIAFFQVLAVPLLPQQRGGKADFVIKLLSDGRQDVVFGDSHVGQWDRMGEAFLFLGRPGLTTFEMAQAMKTYFRDKAPGRVILEAGPQLFAELRQQEWRTLNKDSFKFQLLPLPLYFLEPEVMKKTPAILGLKDGVRFKYKLKSNPPKLPRHVQRARIHGDRLDRVKGRLVTLDDIPEAARETLVSYRYGMQAPVPDADESLAWRHFLSVLDFLASRGAEVCILRMPISPEFQAMIEEERDGWRFDAVIDGLRAEAARRKMRFLDFTEILPGLPSSYYKNQDHLNDLGHELFWPAAVKACFADRDDGGDRHDRVPAYHVLDLENAGFEANLADTERCLPGWLWRSPLAVRHLARHRDAAARSAFGSKFSYGLKAPDAVDGPGWWSLGKRFRAKGGERIALAVKVKSEGLTAVPNHEAAPDGAIFLSDDDVYFEIEVLDAKGETIEIAPDKRRSPPLSRQVVAAPRRQLLPAPWYRLTHRLTLPKAAREFRVWATAVSGGGKARPPGWKGGRPSVLVDDFELLSDGEIAELDPAKPRGKTRAAGRKTKKQLRAACAAKPKKTAKQSSKLEGRGGGT